MCTPAGVRRGLPGVTVHRCRGRASGGPATTTSASGRPWAAHHPGRPPAAEMPKPGSAARRRRGRPAGPRLGVSREVTVTVLHRARGFERLLFSH